MRIRHQQLLLLLGIALVPVFISGWYTLLKADQAADFVETETRERMVAREQHYMLEKVADIGNSLELVASATEGYLEQQRNFITAVLADAKPYDGDVVMSHKVPSHPSAQADKRFDRSVDNQSKHIMVSFEEAAFRFADENCRDCLPLARQLLDTTETLKQIHEGTDAYSLWHYLGLTNGLSMVYPGHGDYPADYDPRQRPWYQQAERMTDISWRPLDIDASTGQPILTAVAPLHDSAGNFLGATAIDLPLHHLLHFESSAAPWLNNARLVLLARTDTNEWEVAAMKEPMAISQDWRSDRGGYRLSQLSQSQLLRFAELQRGDALFLDELELFGDNYRAAVTATNAEGGTLLALVSPHSAIEGAINQAVAVFETERRQTYRNYLVATAALILLVIVIASYFSRRVTDPLVRMSYTASELAQGNLQTRTGISRQDEIGDLSASIDHMADNIEQLQLEQEKAYRDMITSLHRALEKKDSYTAGYSGRVTRYAMKIGERVGLDKETLEILHFGSLTHDLGKIGIPDAVLNKPGPLND